MLDCMQMNRMLNLKSKKSGNVHMFDCVCVCPFQHLISLIQKWVWVLKYVFNQNWDRVERFDTTEVWGINGKTLEPSELDNTTYLIKSSGDSFIL